MKHNALGDLSVVVGGRSDARLECTRKAFRSLPRLHRPRILDVGCGRGDPTLELARLSEGDITAIDIDRAALEELTACAMELGLSERIRVERRSMLEMDYPGGSFDLIWSEGAVFVVGFEHALRQWRTLLAPAGCLVVHDVVWLRPDPPPDTVRYWKGLFPTIQPLEEALPIVPASGYRLLDHFPVSADVWEEDYFAPLEELIAELRPKYAEDPEALAILVQKERQVERYRRDCPWYGSAFFIMQRDDDAERAL